MGGILPPGRGERYHACERARNHRNRRAPRDAMPFGKVRAVWYEPLAVTISADPSARPGTVLSLLAAAVASGPTRRAVEDEHEARDYATLAARVANTAAALRAAG